MLIEQLVLKKYYLYEINKAFNEAHNALNEGWFVNFITGIASFADHGQKLLDSDPNKEENIKIKAWEYKVRKMCERMAKKIVKGTQDTLETYLQKNWGMMPNESLYDYIKRKKSLPTGILLVK